MIQVTMREWNVLTFVRTYWRRHSIAPSMRDIQEGCGIPSTCGVRCTLRTLESAGLIVRYPNTDRTILFVDAPVAVAP